jgi:hypothetical protein
MMPLRTVTNAQWDKITSIQQNLQQVIKCEDNGKRDAKYFVKEFSKYDSIEQVPEKLLEQEFERHLNDSKQSYSETEVFNACAYLVTTGIADKSEYFGEEQSDSLSTLDKIRYLFDHIARNKRPKQGNCWYTALDVYKCHDFSLKQQYLLLLVLANNTVERMGLDQYFENVRKQAVS